MNVAHSFDCPSDVGTHLESHNSEYLNPEYKSESEQECDVDILVPKLDAKDLDRSVWDMCFDDWQQSLCFEFQKVRGCT